MIDVLFLTQRIPYPPIKGEKIRPLQILRKLAAHSRVHLGTLIDQPDDWAHVERVRALCADACFAPLDRRRAMMTCQAGWLTDQPLSFTFFRSRPLKRWVHGVLDRVRPEVVFVCSTNMAWYVMDHPHRPEVLIVDYADTDSEKWREYAELNAPPRRWVYAREARKVRREERRIAARADWCTFVTEHEAATFRAIAPAQDRRIRAVPSGVDTAYFAPSHAFEPPFEARHPTFVFTGTMDYWPNVDAVTWFATTILPGIRRAAPGARFQIVGANPAPAVVRLGELDGVTVTGRVPDVRPYLAHAVAAVAPLRVARGVQNKVLEAMAMGRPVVATQGALTGIDARPGRHLLQADDAKSFAGTCLSLIADEETARRLGRNARDLVGSGYSWAARLRGFDPLLPDWPAAEAEPAGSEGELEVCVS